MSKRKYWYKINGKIKKNILGSQLWETYSGLKIDVNKCLYRMLAVQFPGSGELRKSVHMDANRASKK